MKIGPYFHLLVRLLQTTRNWPVYFLNRYGFMTQGTIRYRLWNGMTVISRPFHTDGSALNDVWLDETYDPNHYGIPYDWSQSKTIVDIGANIGTFTLYAAWRSPQARILAAEPEPGNASMWRTNMAENHLTQRCTLEEAAIGASPGTLTLHVARKNSGGHSLYHYTDASDPVTVRVQTLKALLERNDIRLCDYLKLDCEGGEYEGLYSLTPEQLKGIRFMAIEVHHFSQDPRHQPAALTAYLEENGFRVVEAKKSILFAQCDPRQ